MQSKVISEKFKAWCPDGFTREALNIGDIRDFGSAESGLMQAGFVEPVDDEEPAKVDVAPVVKAEKLEKQTTTEEPTVIEQAQVVEKPAAVFKPKKNK